MINPNFWPVVYISQVWIKKKRNKDKYIESINPSIMYFYVTQFFFCEECLDIFFYWKMTKIQRKYICSVNLQNISENYNVKTSKNILCNKINIRFSILHYLLTQFRILWNETPLIKTSTHKSLSVSAVGRIRLTLLSSVLCGILAYSSHSILGAGGGNSGHHSSGVSWLMPHVVLRQPLQILTKKSERENETERGWVQV